MKSPVVWQVRGLASKATKVPPKKSSTASSLHLPKTGFPLKAAPNRHLDTTVIERVTTQAYKRQELIRKDAPVFSLLDGPPFANGQLHSGHFLNKVLKDSIMRFQATLGKRIRFVPGWDCHGLPIELMSLKAEQAKAVKSGGSKESATRASSQIIRDRCRAFAQTAIESQLRDFRSWGVLADWTNVYTTMDKSFEAREAKVLARLLKEGLISRALKPVHWSPASQTALADAELEYKDNHKSLAVYARFGSLNGVEGLKDLGAVDVLIWTTTPWSLTANRAVAANPEAIYVAVKSMQGGNAFLVAKDLVASLPKEVVLDVALPRREVKGKELIGATCISPLTGGRVPIVVGKHVTTDTGTGLVHIAPAHGLEDLECLEKEQWFNKDDMRKDLKIDDAGVFRFSSPHDGQVIPEVCHLVEGKKALQEGNALLADYLLKTNKLLVAAKEYEHKYPYDWRTKTPVMTRAAEQFFIRVDDGVVERAQQAIESSVKFVPERGASRLTSTIRTRKEWCISRQRVWGLPIPYYSRVVENGKTEILFTEELVQRFSERCAMEGSNFWFENTSDMEDLVLPEGERQKGWTRGRDTLDVWFDSGSAWFASDPGRDFDAVDDVVLEGSDQHRGWFQSAILTKAGCSPEGSTSAPYKAVVTHGFVLDEKMQKMSKSIGNIVLPGDAIAKYGGVDAVRFWACFSDAFTGDVTLGPQSLAGAADQVKKLRNVLRFLLSVCEDESIDFEKAHREPLDEFILSELESARSKSNAAFSEYQVRDGLRHIVEFVNGDALTVYLDQTKDRLYCERKSSERRISCVSTCRTLVRVLAVMLSPVCVFTIDELIANGKNTFEGAENPIDLIAPPRLPIIESPSKDLAFRYMLELRGEINKLGIKEEDRLDSNLEITVSSESVLEAVQWLNRPFRNSQWSPLAEVLQVRKITLKSGAPNLTIIVKEDRAVKCERCRRFHVTAIERQLREKDSCILCDRCHDAHTHDGL